MKRLLKVVRVFNAGWCTALSALPMPIFNITNWQLLLYMLHAENASKLLHIIPACVVRRVCSLNKSTNLHYWFFPVWVFSQNTDSRATAAFSKTNVQKLLGGGGGGCKWGGCIFQLIWLLLMVAFFPSFYFNFFNIQQSKGKKTAQLRNFETRGNHDWQKHHHLTGSNE